MNNNGPLKLKAQSHEGKGKLDYIIIISMINVSLERGRFGCGTVHVTYIWAEALREVLKLLRKVDARMEII